MDSGVRRHGLEHLRAKLPALTRPRVELAVCAIFRDEARYLSEWVAFHRLMGVERFYLYDNDSADDWQRALEGFSGVAVTPWPAHPGQFSAYADCLRRHRVDTRWIAFIDIDEFLFSPSGRQLPEVLCGFDGAAAVAVNWRCFGHGDWTERPPGLVTESYLWRARDDHAVNRHVKSIVKPRKVSTWIDNPHQFRHYAPVVGENEDPVTSAFRDPPTADLLRINHYVLKSEAEFREKMSRRRADIEASREGERLPDEVRDETILRYLPALRD